MLKSLGIKNLAIIEDLELDFAAGFTVLTGETGAGKSIIIGGILLALGEKTSPDVIRTGEKETQIEAIFEVAPATGKHLASEDTTELLLQRKIVQNGPGKSYLNGTLSPIKKMKETSRFLLDIYGQNDHVFLRQTTNQLSYLDEYGGTKLLRDETAAMIRSLKQHLREKDLLLAKKKEREQKRDFLAFQIKEIKNAQLEPKEEEQIHKERDILKNAEKISSWTEEALDLSYSGETSILSSLTRLQQLVKQLQPFSPEISSIESALGQFSINLKEFADFLIKFRELRDSSPEKLEALEERLSLIEDLKRKYGNSIPEILEFSKKAQTELNALDASSETLETLLQKIKNIYKALQVKTRKLTSARQKSARELEKKIESEIGQLGMKKACLQIALITYFPDWEEIEKIKERGADEVEFLLSPNPGEEPKPLRNIASGGELSRLMLALKSVSNDSEKNKTLIFDEIDAGIGGKTAESVAIKLTGLSRENQVLCITHLPQIASFADYHYKIEKKVVDNRTYTAVSKLTGEARVKELARLIAGSHITPTALQNAREMLELNQNP